MHRPSWSWNGGFSRSPNATVHSTLASKQPRSKSGWLQGLGCNARKGLPEADTCSGRSKATPPDCCLVQYAAGSHWRGHRPVAQTAVCLRERPWRTFRVLALTDLIKLSSFFSVFLTLFSFLTCLYCINCLVCYKVEELRSRCGAKLQHVFFSIFFRCISAKISKSDSRTKKFCGNKTSTGWWTRENLTIHFTKVVLGTHIRCDGQYICQMVGNLFSVTLPKIVDIRLSYCKNKKGAVFLDTL